MGGSADAVCRVAYKSVGWNKYPPQIPMTAAEWGMDATAHFDLSNVHRKGRELAFFRLVLDPLRITKDARPGDVFLVQINMGWIYGASIVTKNRHATLAPGCCWLLFIPFGPRAQCRTGVTAEYFLANGLRMEDFEVHPMQCACKWTED